MSKRKKGTRTIHVPGHEKYTRRESQPDSFFHKNPSWRFQFMDKEEWPPVNNISDIVKKLCEYEKMTWAVIDGASKSGKGSRNHYVPVIDMCKRARVRLEQLNLTYDEYYSIALTGKSRLWGILESGIFHILWYDPYHEVCPSVKRHT